MSAAAEVERMALKDALAYMRDEMGSGINHDPGPLAAMLLHYYSIGAERSAKGKP